MEYLLVLVVLAVAIYVIAAPLRAGHEKPGAGPPAADVAELEAARDAKYREIRDAELDLRTGKLSGADYQAIDGALRAEAIEILRRLDQVAGAPGRVPSTP